MDIADQEADAQHAILGVLRPVGQEGPVRDGVVDTRVVNGLTLITLAGELDLSVAPTVRRALIQAPAASLPDLAIDLRQVDFMDCSIIGVLMQAHTTVTAAGGCLRLIGPQPEPAKLLGLCQPSGLLCIYEAMPAGISACHRHDTSDARRPVRSQHK